MTAPEDDGLDCIGCYSAAKVVRYDPCKHEEYCHTCFQRTFGFTEVRGKCGTCRAVITGATAPKPGAEDERMNIDVKMLMDLPHLSITAGRSFDEFAPGGEGEAGEGDATVAAIEAIVDDVSTALRQQIRTALARPETSTRLSLHVQYAYPRRLWERDGFGERVLVPNLLIRCVGGIGQRLALDAGGRMVVGEDANGRAPPSTLDDVGAIPLDVRRVMALDEITAMRDKINVIASDVMRLEAAGRVMDDATVRAISDVVERAQQRVQLVEPVSAQILGTYSGESAIWRNTRARMVMIRENFELIDAVVLYTTTPAHMRRPHTTFAGMMLRTAMLACAGAAAIMEHIEREHALREAAEHTSAPGVVREPIPRAAGTAAAAFEALVAAGSPERAGEVLATNRPYQRIITPPQLHVRDVGGLHGPEFLSGGSSTIRSVSETGRAVVREPLSRAAGAALDATVAAGVETDAAAARATAESEATERADSESAAVERAGAKSEDAAARVAENLRCLTRAPRARRMFDTLSGGGVRAPRVDSDASAAAGGDAAAGASSDDECESEDCA